MVAGQRDGDELRRRTTTDYHGDGDTEREGGGEDVQEDEKLTPERLVTTAWPEEEHSAGELPRRSSDTGEEEKGRRRRCTAPRLDSSHGEEEQAKARIFPHTSERGGGRNGVKRGSPSS